MRFWAILLWHSIFHRLFPELFLKRRIDFSSSIKRAGSVGTDQRCYCRSESKYLCTNSQNKGKLVLSSSIPKKKSVRHSRKNFLLFLLFSNVSSSHKNFTVGPAKLYHGVADFCVKVSVMELLKFLIEVRVF